MTALPASEHVRIDAVRFAYGGSTGAPILQDLSLSVQHGAFVAILGPSGGGKSTVLKLLSGLVTPLGGTIRIDDTPVTGPRRDVGTVFQKPKLLPWRTVRDNVLLPAGFARAAAAREVARADALLATVGLSDSASLYPGQLSGGMAQRVGLARMLLHDPRLLLLDEPFSALDAMTREHLSLELQRLWMEERRTALFVTHSIPEALFLADRVVVLAGRPGRILADMPVPLPRPRTLETISEPRFGALALELRRLFDTAARHGILAA
ncbi:ABC transporter ATP-binding protein (plasmid) [Methylobacterium sp. NMS14P]|uniref:ABC transporter ATP-binding protein n=1 Tax=Methylobacterium sp. NMS14P TaxID=2894310 RepID=UPI0023588086|nr:ABC transporter ATP-binding protein [Methylobacterium sp. NMS14P]WCS28708.1 ABC transporter ATP-binding protein [Methylobacterium sp. NMS14P]